MPFAPYKEGRIFYREYGKGRPLLLLHGYLGNHSYWSKIIPKLAQKFRVIVPDLPGHGKSSSFGYIHRMETMAESVFELLKHLKIRKVVVAGHSMGGYTSLALAEKYPDLLRGLILVHSTVLPDSDQKRNDRDKAIKVAKISYKRYLKEAINILLWKENRANKDLTDFIETVAGQTPQQGAIAALEGMKVRKNMEILLHYLTYPICFIQGKHDEILPAETHKFQWKIASESEIHELEKSGHMSFLEEPELLSEILIKFTSRAFRRKIS